MAPRLAPGPAPCLSTKARTLASLAGTLASASVLPLSWFTVAQWRQDPAQVLAALHREFGPPTQWTAHPLVVRSSAQNEDGASASLAGAYTSILDLRDETALRTAIDTVIASYGKTPEATAEEEGAHEVLVQPMLQEVDGAGVVFSHDPASGSPYRVINHAPGSDTTLVTRGDGLPRTLILAPGAAWPDAGAGEPGQERERIEAVAALMAELCRCFPGQPLDAEYAFARNPGTPGSAPALTDGRRLFLLQVRPLIVAATAQHGPLAPLLEQVAAKVRALQTPHPFLHGRSTVLGVMPDWNPAEIIGVRPRPLALSLYRDLVTDAIWAYQRHNYGYRNLRSFPLLVHFFGQPYIDVRVSFNSFIPRDVAGSLADRLVDYYIDRLLAAPSLHDKVEFEIVYSCYTLDLPQRLEALNEHGFSREEQTALADALRRLTNRVMHKETGLWIADRDKLATLVARREQILGSNLDMVGRIYWLLEDCKRYGTLPFAGLARAGFIAVQMLKSLVAVGVFSLTDYDRFMNGLDTVSSQLARDRQQLDRSTFLARYGHLRPGTYDILSPRYDEAPDHYFQWSAPVTERPTHPARETFSLSLRQMRETARLLAEHGLSSDVVGLFDFLQAGIELREYAKFVFTRSLSDALSLLRRFGEQQGFSADEMSYAHIGCIHELHGGAGDARTILGRAIEEGKARYGETRQLWLPPLITRPEDVYAFEMPEAEPNFITQGQVTGPVVGPEEVSRLPGGIVFIPSADPGFDWLFAHPLGGLVTAYGGANSHMAIRANELGLPAVIGAGEALFQRWRQAGRLHIDCAARRVDRLP